MSKQSCSRLSKQLYQSLKIVLLILQILMIMIEAVGVAVVKRRLKLQLYPVDGELLQ